MHANILQTFHGFATEYFAAKCFIFTTESLKVLLHIANHIKLCTYLTKVYFAPAQVVKPKSHCEHGQPIKATVRQREALADYMADQMQLRTSGNDKRMIIEAFSKLPCVRLLGVVDTVTGLPEGAECRGLQKITRTTGTRPSLTGIDYGQATPSKLTYGWLSHVWTTALHALAESGVSTVTRLETDLGSGLSPITDLKLKNVPSQLLSVLANLRELSIQIRTQNFRLNKSDVEEDAHRTRSALKVFGAALPSLTSLRLAFDVDSGALAAGFLKAFISKIDAGNLTKFSLDSLCIDVKTLAGIVCKLKSVQILALYLVSITQGGDWKPILKAIAQLPTVNHLHLMYLTEGAFRVYFLDQPSLDEGGLDASFDIFGHPVPGGNEDQWTDDGGSGSDDELPPLIPDGVNSDEPSLEAESVSAPPTTATAATPATTTKKTPCKQDGGKDYKAPGCQSHAERGYYVCIQGREVIQREIPRLIQKYNTGESEDDISNNLFNTIFGGGAAGGLGGPFMGMPGPAPAGAGAGAANANGGGNLLANLQANLQANVNVGGNPIANMQAMFGPPTQVGGNALNGFATYAIPVPAGNAANLLANPFAGMGVPAQQAAQPPQAPQPPQAQQTAPAPQTTPTPQTAQPQQTTQSQQAAPADVGAPAVASASSLDTAATTEGAADEWTMADEWMEDELD